MRAKRKLHEDDVQVCLCSNNGKIWNRKICGSLRCLNRLIKTECVEKFCSESCENRRFQKKQWKKVKVEKVPLVCKNKFALEMGDKGKGLVAAENIKSGEFVIEYIGEVTQNWWSKFSNNAFLGERLFVLL